MRKFDIGVIVLPTKDAIVRASQFGARGRNFRKNNKQIYACNPCKLGILSRRRRKNNKQRTNKQQTNNKQITIKQQHRNNVNNVNNVNKYKAAPAPRIFHAEKYDYETIRKRVKEKIKEGIAIFVSL